MILLQKKYGLLNSAANRRAFSQDSSYCLLASLEFLDEEGKLKRKADIFHKRTIRKAEPIERVDTASEALCSVFGRTCKNRFVLYDRTDRKAGGRDY